MPARTDFSCGSTATSSSMSLRRAAGCRDVSASCVQKRRYCARTISCGDSGVADGDGAGDADSPVDDGDKAGVSVGKGAASLLSPSQEASTDTSRHPTRPPASRRQGDAPLLDAGDMSGRRCVCSVTAEAPIARPAVGPIEGSQSVAICRGCVNSPPDRGARVRSRGSASTIPTAFCTIPRAHDFSKAYRPNAILWITSGAWTLRKRPSGRAPIRDRVVGGRAPPGETSGMVGNAYGMVDNDPGMVGLERRAHDGVVGAQPQHRRART